MIQELNIINFHNLAKQDWPSELSNEQLSQWIGKVLKVQELGSLTDICNRIIAFSQSKPTLWKCEQVEDLLTVANRLQERNIDTQVLQKLILTQAPKDSLKIITLKEGNANLQMAKSCLVVKSVYFKTLLTGNVGLPVEEIELKEDPLEAIQALFTYLQTGKVNINDEIALDLLRVACKYKVETLAKACEQWIIQHVDLLASGEVLWEIVNTTNTSLLQQALFEVTLKAFMQQDDGLDSAEAKWLIEGGRTTKSLSLIDLTLIKLNFLLKVCPHVTQFELKKCGKISDNDLKETVEKLTLLKSLNISDCRPSDNIIIALAAKLSQLTHLNLSGCYWLTDSAIIDGVANLKQLTDLKMDCWSVTDASFIEIGRKLSQLIRLNFKESGNRKLTDATIIEGVAKLDQLIHLSFCNPNLTDKALLEIITKLSRLTKLSVSYVFGLTDKAVIEMTQLDQLTNLNIRGCFNLTNAGFIEGVAKLSRLTKLNVSNCRLENAAIIEGVAKLNQLTELNISTHSITDVAIIEGVAKLKQLKKLNVSCCQITDVAIIEMAKLSQLTKLNIACCDDLTIGAIIKVVAKLSQLTQIDVGDYNDLLKVSNYTNLTDSSLIKAAAQINQRNMFNVSDYRLLKISTVIEIANKFNALLNPHDVLEPQTVTVMSMIEIAEKLIKLTQLDIFDKRYLLRSECVNNDKLKL